jgi:hypothetical protein
MVQGALACQIACLFICLFACLQCLFTRLDVSATEGMYVRLGTFLANVAKDDSSQVVLTSRRISHLCAIAMHKLLSSHEKRTKKGFKETGHVKEAKMTETSYF